MFWKEGQDNGVTRHLTPRGPNVRSISARAGSALCRTARETEGVLRPRPPRLREKFNCLGIKKEHPELTTWHIQGINFPEEK